MKKFFGRRTELKQLQDLINSRESQIAVVYGRRRIGKTRLVREACRSRTVFSFEGLENQSKPQQIINFLFQIEQQTGVALAGKSQVRTWSDAFAKLLPFVRRSPNGTVIFLDEFQWMANYRSQLVSELKMLWEQYFSKISGCKLVVCGSIASFLVKKVIQSKALYGRVNLEIHLEELKLSEAHEFLPHHSKEDVLFAYLIFGGVPKYLELLRPTESVPQAIQRLFFEKNASLTREYKTIFTSHFGTDSVYEEIIKELKNKYYGLTRDELTSRTAAKGGGQLSHQLYDLEMAGFLKSYVPFNKTRTSKIRKYKLVDSYTSFFLNFVEPKVNFNTSTNFLNHIFPRPAFRSWLGHSFENVCLVHSKEIAKHLGFSGIEYSVGPYFTRERSNTQHELDLVYDRADRVLTVCELKYQDTPLGIGTAKKLQEKIISNLELHGKTIQRVIVSNARGSKELERSSLIQEVVSVYDLF